VIVGDISGHGRQALPQTTNVRFTLRTYLEAGSSPRASLQAAAGVLDRQLGDSFATVVLATYDPRERLLVYACAGHPAPLVIGDQPIAHLSSCSAPPLGVGQPTGTRETRVRLPGAATVCFYTDGVVEARRKGELYGRERLARAVLELGPHERATDLLDRIARESESHTDDMAACILRVPGPSEQPVLEREQIEVDGAEAGRERVLRLLLAAGVAADSARSVLASARRLVREHGRVVLDVDLMDTPPSVELWPQNLSVLPPAGHRQAGAATGA
jgi:hypothetical protein